MVCKRRQGAGLPRFPIRANDAGVENGTPRGADAGSMSCRPMTPGHLAEGSASLLLAPVLARVRAGLSTETTSKPARSAMC